jgi:2-polyprenyl-6-methoxyphenol hydroxylase-like FAD-dependent oxidoreductase
MGLQVLIAGAGPVGLTLAAELARYGVSVRLIDKTAAGTDKSKALVVWSRTLELLDRAGCADAFIAAGQKVVAANVVAGGDKEIGRIDLTDVDSPYPYALMLPQSETERLLEEHLGRLGLRVERSTELVDFAAADSALVDGGSGVTATVRRPDGTSETIDSDWLVGCDGAHSTVRHQRGMAFPGDTLDTEWVLADVHVTGLTTPESELALYWHEDGMLAFFPIGPGRYRIIADLGPPRTEHLQDPTLAEIQALVERRGPAGIALTDPVWLSAFRINERKVEHYRDDKIFLAGDAAHIHSPAGGQGMNTGMQDAFNLAWKLALVGSGQAGPERLLASYSAERSPIGAQVVANTARLTTLATLRGHTVQAARNFIAGLVFGLAPVRRAMASAVTEISIGYPHSPLNGPAHHTHPAPGERMPPQPGEAPIGAGTTPRFALFAAPGEAVTALLRQCSELLEPVPRAPLHAEASWLVRPDGYVAAVAAPGDEACFADYLENL